MKFQNSCSYELRHHGIKGQKWGVRRYQNPDGSLTPEGQRHYNVERINELGRRSREARKEADKAERDALIDSKWYLDVEKNGYKGEAANEFVANMMGIKVDQLDSAYKNNKEDVDYYVDMVKEMYLQSFIENATYAGLLRKYANNNDEVVKEMSKDLNKDYSKNAKLSDDAIEDISDLEGYKHYAKIRRLPS